MSSPVKPWVNVAVSILSSALTVLLLIPGNQGESVLQKAIEILKGLLAVS